MQSEVIRGHQRSSEVIRSHHHTCMRASELVTWLSSFRIVCFELASSADTAAAALNLPSSSPIWTRLAWSSACVFSSVCWAASQPAR